jgi:hypothetical protein
MADALEPRASPPGPEEQAAAARRRGTTVAMGRERVFMNVSLRNERASRRGACADAGSAGKSRHPVREGRSAGSSGAIGEIIALPPIA